MAKAKLKPIYIRARDARPVFGVSADFLRKAPPDLLPRKRLSARLTLYKVCDVESYIEWRAANNG